MKRNVLITGVSSGIGLEVAKALLQQGCRVIGLSRSEPELADYGDFVFIELDLAAPEASAEQFSLYQAQWRDCDAVLFNAGFGQFASMEEFSISQIQALIAVNFTSQVLLARLLIPQFKRNGGGNMIFIGSEAALKGSRKGAVYCASKFAIRGFAQALRDETARSGIRVTVINPGMVKSAFFDDLDFEPGDLAGQFISVSDVVQTILFVLQASPHVVLDEINLSPLNKVINFKKN